MLYADSLLGYGGHGLKKVHRDITLTVNFNWHFKMADFASGTAPHIFCFQHHNLVYSGIFLALALL